MPVAGLRGTGDWGTDERPKNFRESILWMTPNGDTPLLGLSSQIKGKTYVVNDPEFSWWCEPQDLVRLQINGAHLSTDTLLNVDSADPTASVLKTSYGKATNLTVGDVLMVEPTADSASDTYERVIVTGVLSDTQFTVQRGAFGTTPAAISDNVYLLLIGSAFAEGTGAPSATSRNPIKFSNYTQIFKTSYEVTGTADATEARTGNVLTNDKKRRSFDHAKKLELALLFGQKSESVGANGKPLRSMAGLRSFIPAANQTILTTNWGLMSGAGGSLIDAISPVFDYVSPGGDTRIAFCGNGALNGLNKAIAKVSGATGTQIMWGMDEKYWGMNFRELVFPQGRLMLKTHPLLSRHSIYTNSMFILDMSALKYAPMKGRDTKAFDDVQTKEEDVRRGYWQTECSLLVDFAGQTMGYVGGFGATPA